MLSLASLTIANGGADGRSGRGRPGGGRSISLAFGCAESYFVVLAAAPSEDHETLAYSELALRTGRRYECYARGDDDVESSSCAAVPSVPSPRAIHMRYDWPSGPIVHTSSSPAGVRACVIRGRL